MKAVTDIGRTQLVAQGAVCCDCMKVLGPNDPADPAVATWKPKGRPRRCRRCRAAKFRTRVMQDQRREQEVMRG